MTSQGNCAVCGRRKSLTKDGRITTRHSHCPGAGQPPRDITTATIGPEITVGQLYDQLEPGVPMVVTVVGQPIVPEAAVDIVARALHDAKAAGEFGRNNFEPYDTLSDFGKLGWRDTARPVVAAAHPLLAAGEYRRGREDAARDAMAALNEIYGEGADDTYFAIADVLRKIAGAPEGGRG